MWQADSGQRASRRALSPVPDKFSWHAKHELLFAEHEPARAFEHELTPHSVKILQIGQNPGDFFVSGP
jgi:hypothetical protein